MVVVPLVVLVVAPKSPNTKPHTAITVIHPCTLLSQSFMPGVASTSGRLPRELLRRLFLSRSSGKEEAEGEGVFYHDENLEDESV